MKGSKQTGTISFLVLWGLGLPGIFSLFATTTFPLKDETTPFLSRALIVAKMVAPVVALTGSVLIGTFFAPKVGLSSSLVQAFTAKRSMESSLSSQVLSGILGGFVLGCVDIVTFHLFQPFFLAGFVARYEEIPILLKLLHGGINEELIFRWGIMSFALWIFWRVFQKREGLPRNFYCWVAILLSAFFFALLHLPWAFKFPESSFALLILYFFFMNLFAGVVLGWLFWKKGLESSILAHMLGHATLHSSLVIFKAFLEM